MVCLRSILINYVLLAPVLYIVMLADIVMEIYYVRAVFSFPQE